jgi:hypothetical protein
VATKIKTQESAIPTDAQAGVEREGHSEGQATAGASAVVFNGKKWQTPDGRQFNTCLKARLHIQDLIK